MSRKKHHEKEQEEEHSLLPSFLPNSNVLIATLIIVFLAAVEYAVNVFHNAPINTDFLTKYIVANGMYAMYANQGEMKQKFKAIFLKLQIADRLQQDLHEMSGQFKYVVKVAMAQNLYDQPELMRKAIDGMIQEYLEGNLRELIRAIIKEIDTDNESASASPNYKEDDLA